MQENVGPKERWLRAAAGSALVLAGLRRLRSSEVKTTLLFTAGALLLDTAITRVCPVNELFKRERSRLARERQLGRLRARSSERPPEAWSAAAPIAAVRHV